MLETHLMFVNKEGVSNFMNMRSISVLFCWFQYISEQNLCIKMSGVLMTSVGGCL